MMNHSSRAEFLDMDGIANFSRPSCCSDGPLPVQILIIADIGKLGNQRCLNSCPTMCVTHWLSRIDLDPATGGDCLLYTFMFWDAHCHDTHRPVKKILDSLVSKFKPQSEVMSVINTLATHPTTSRICSPLLWSLYACLSPFQVQQINSCII